MTPEPAGGQMAKSGPATKMQLAEIPSRKASQTYNSNKVGDQDQLDMFKQFSAAEKLRMSERQRLIGRETKAVTLGDLKNFAANFKLDMPIPTDLIPILAKDETKQQLLVQKHLAFLKEQQTVEEQALKVKLTSLNPTSPPFVPSSSSNTAKDSSAPRSHGEKMQADVAQAKSSYVERQESLVAVNKDSKLPGAGIGDRANMLNDQKAGNSADMEPPHDEKP